MSKYYEVVFEGDKEVIAGFLTGYMLGANQNYFFCFSENLGVKAETLAETIKEWISLKNRIHYVIMEEKFYQTVDKILKENTKSEIISQNHIKSARAIIKGGFSFKTVTYGRKYAEEIKQLIANLPKELRLEGYEPKEEIHKDAKGVELYSPDHDYTFSAEGLISGEIRELLDTRQKFVDYPLIEAGEIKLTFE